MKIVWILLLGIGISACTTPIANISPSPQGDGIATWTLEAPSRKHITHCDGTNLRYFQLTIEPSGAWTGRVQLYNYDPGQYRDNWNNRLTVAFKNGDTIYGSFPLLNETMSANTKRSYDVAGNWPEAQGIYDSLKLTEAVLTHECEGFNDT